MSVSGDGVVPYELLPHAVMHIAAMTITLTRKDIAVTSGGCGEQTRCPCARRVLGPIHAMQPSEILESSWAKNRIRGIIVRQANQYLTATLEIGRLEGTFFRGIQLGDIRLSRNGRELIAIDDVSLNYSLRELFQPGVVIRKIRLARP